MNCQCPDARRESGALAYAGARMRPGRSICHPLHERSWLHYGKGLQTLRSRSARVEWLLRGLAGCPSMFAGLRLSVAGFSLFFQFS